MQVTRFQEGYGQPVIEFPSHNRYSIQGQLGQGAYGQVYQVRNLQTKILYALKKQKVMNQEEQIIIQLLVNKQFRNLVNVVEYYQSASDKYYYIVMEYCDSDLYQQLQRETIQEEDIRYIMISIATGIQELHSQNIIHRDIKPENILIQNLRNAQGRTQKIYKICDFGLSKQVDLTKTTKQGTPYYLSPEQLNPGNYTNKIDIWAFGAVIYELLMKKPLFDGQTKEQVYKKIQHEDINKLLSTILKSQLPYQILLKQMLDRDPLRRPNIEQVILKLSPIIKSLGKSPAIRHCSMQPQTEQVKAQVEKQHNYHNIQRLPQTKQDTKQQSQDTQLYNQQNVNTDKQISQNGKNQRNINDQSNIKEPSSQNSNGDRSNNFQRSYKAPQQSYFKGHVDGNKQNQPQINVEMKQNCLKPINLRAYTPPPVSTNVKQSIVIGKTFYPKQE